jgi:hypothetical protein
MMRHEDQAHERYTTRHLVFSRPFVLGTSPEIYPAGTYEVETKQEAWEASGHSALRRTSTVLVVPTATGTLHREVSGTELDRAVARDAEQSGGGEPSENPDRGEARTLETDAPR